MRKTKKIKRHIIIVADNHEDKRIVSFETEFDRELATNSNNKKTTSHEN